MEPIHDSHRTRWIPGEANTMCSVCLVCNCHGDLTQPCAGEPQTAGGAA